MLLRLQLNLAELSDMYILKMHRIDSIDKKDAHLQYKLLVESVENFIYIFF